MRKNGVISVIIPVYGVEKYLEECIESVLCQTYTNLEVILVDDGSPDRCGEICDRYAERDSRLIVLHQKNAGAAAARNAGLRIAAGEYIAFADGDDYLEPDAYAHMVRTLEDTDADIVQCGFRNVYANGKQIVYEEIGSCNYSTTAYLMYYVQNWSCALCWNKLFRHSVLTDVFFEEGHLIDDEFFTYRVVMNAAKIVCIPKVVYNYRQRASSVMKKHDTIERKCEDIFAYLEQRSKQVADRFPELETLYNDSYVDHLLYLATTEMGTKKTIREIKKRLIRHAAVTKMRLWRKGQRKRSLRILAFSVTPVGMLMRRKAEGKDIGYEFFE